MKLLRAYPAGKLDLGPHAKPKSARELAWVSAIEAMPAQRVYRDELATRGLSGLPPEAPAHWAELLSGVEKAHRQLREFMLADEIHHRGQFSVCLRMSGAKVPSIYGPTADEPWI